MDAKMTIENSEIRLFEPHSATEQEWSALNTFTNHLNAEMLPDDPPETIERTVSFWSHIPAFWGVTQWLAWRVEPAEIVAEGIAFIGRTEDNQHLLDFQIRVLQGYRRQGLGRRILLLIVEKARSEGRRLLISESNSNVPAGIAFLNRIGARVGLATHTNQMAIADVDHKLLQQWQDQAHERAPGYEIGIWEGPYPQRDIPEIIALYRSMNLEPRGELEIEDFEFTEEQLRQREEAMLKRKSERMTMYVRHTQTRELAGFTEALWNPNMPWVMTQLSTAVWPAHRGRGLGRWLKAAMLEKVISRYPQVKYVRTGNADSNAAMLRINNDLGFKPYFEGGVWQVEVDRVQEYLSSSAMAE